MSRPVLRLIADDLTGALDTAAELAGLAGPVPVRWEGATEGAADGAGSLAVATGTRETSRADAIGRVAGHAGLLAGADIAFKKIDSLLRGHPTAELAACLRAGAWRSVVLAPAFPAQGRATRDGAQFARDPDGSWRQVADALPALLDAEGLACRIADPAAQLPPGIAVFDAGTEDEMRRIAACGRAAPGPILWCGSGGLGRALAALAPLAEDRALRGPVLGLFGSDQAVTTRQLAACGPAWERLAEDTPLGDLARRLETRGAALASLVLPAGLGRDAAAARIARAFAAVVRALPPPGTLLVAGGETLGSICAALGAEALVARGVVAPGVPRSVLRGGRWDGVEVISKSGAFGGDTIWRDLLAANGFITDPCPT